MGLKEDIGSGESRILEFKEKIPRDTMKLVRAAIAFSNTQGGRIIIGVNDDRRIVGLNEDPFLVRDRAIDIISNGCEPRISPNSYITTIDGRDLVVIMIEAGADRPYHIKGENPESSAYVRTSASNRLPSSGMLKELELEGARRSFDSLDYLGDAGDVQDLAKGLCGYLSQRSGRAVAIAHLEGMGLLRESEGRLVPSRAFMLLTSNPYYQARVQCARFRGRNMVEFIDRKEFNGPLTDQVDQTVGFIMDHTNLGGKIVGLYREDTPEIPVEAVREFVTNALEHRSYAMESNPVFVAVFDDRVEITSPGMLPQGFSMDKVLSGLSNPRNEVIARFFREAKLTEGWGSGLIRAIELCTSHGLKAPHIEELDDFIRVTIYRLESAPADESEGIEIVLSETEMAIVDLIQADCHIKTHDMALVLNKPDSTIRRLVAGMQKRGILSRIGAKQSSEWVITGYLKLRE